MIIIKRLNLVFQENSYDCGLACLLMIARYYNCNVPKDYLENVSMTMKDGTSMYGLMRAMISLGFVACGKEANVNDLDKSSLPLIAHIKLNEERALYHYVVVTNNTNKKITIKDRSRGTKTMLKDDFSKLATGN